MTKPISEQAADLGEKGRAKRHKHSFAALWWHFGQYGRQDVHVHSCFDTDCQRVLIGDGRDCNGVYATHRRETLR